MHNSNQTEGSNITLTTQHSGRTRTRGEARRQLQLRDDLFNYMQHYYYKASLVCGQPVHACSSILPLVHIGISVPIRTSVASYYRQALWTEWLWDVGKKALVVFYRNIFRKLISATLQAWLSGRLLKLGTSGTKALPSLCPHGRPVQQRSLGSTQPLRTTM